MCLERLGAHRLKCRRFDVILQFLPFSVSASPCLVGPGFFFPYLNRAPKIIQFDLFRFRSDFSAADYVQHKFRYFDARFLDSARGQRVAWALFNTALREQSRQTGHLVHKNSSEKALSLQELRDLVNSREDLVRKVATFGAEIPTTPMHWKKEGNHLEWIVRQMSWFPPWCFFRRA